MLKVTLNHTRRLPLRDRRVVVCLSLTRGGSSTPSAATSTLLCGETTFSRRRNGEIGAHRGEAKSHRRDWWLPVRRHGGVLLSAWCRQIWYLVAQVAPPMMEREMITMIVDTLPVFYYEKMVGFMPCSFADLVFASERIEVGFADWWVSCW